MSKIAAILRPKRLWTIDEVRARPCPVPHEPGLYGWYFSAIPPTVPTAKCVVAHGSTLLYAGISPSAPPRNGRPPSSQTLRKRIRTHVRGNASASTLRLTLGCLLQGWLGIELRPVGRTRRLTFGADGEAALSAWIREHSRVVWLVDAEPWGLERSALGAVSLPLNLAGNGGHPFHAELSRLRRDARGRGRQQF